MINYLKMGALSPRQILVGCLLLACSASISFGQSVYKTVDAEGKVSYSTEPPDDNSESQKLDLLAEPSATDIEEAQKRIQKTQEKLDKNQEDRHREAERNARAATKGTDTVVLVQPAPAAALFYPYANHHGYRSHRRGYRYGHRHRYDHHYRRSVIGPYRRLGPTRRPPGYATQLPSRRYSSQSRY